jgi:radical SAM protein with 4Fe4S-binding SPASM domain
LALLVDGELPAAEALGLRNRPWLRALCLPAGAAPETPVVLPAPLERFSRLEDLLAHAGPPPTPYAATACAFPPKIQIETTTECHSLCAFCPKASQPPERGLMGEALFCRIIDECAVGKPDSLELYLQGEPLLDDRLERLATLAKERCPDSLVAIITHERAIDEARAASLAASGLDIVNVSTNVVGRGNDGALRARLERLAGLREILLRRGKQLVLVTLENLHDESGLARFRELCAELGLPLEEFRATSRAGDAAIGTFQRAGDRPPRRLCERPFAKAYIRWDGRMVLCCEDWRFRRVMGDVHEQSIAAIWNGEAYRQVRRELLTDRRAEPCDRCDYVEFWGRP